MPRVAAYGPRRVATAPLQGGDRRYAEESFESAGGQRAQAQAGLGAVVARVGAGVAAEAFRAEQERADQVANLTTLRQLNELDQQVLKDPEKGILNKRGLAAMEGRDEAIGRWDEQAGMIQANLRTDRQKLFFEQQRVNRRGRLIEQVEEHGTRELRAHDDAETEAFVVSSQSRARSNASNPHIVTEAIAEQEAAIRDYTKRNGLGPEKTQQLLEQSRNATWSSAIVQNIADGNVAAARSYFEEARDAGLLTGEALTRMTDAVKQGVANVEGEAAAEEIWTAKGPADDNAPIQIDQMEAEARKRFKGNPEALNATIAALRSRKQGVDAGRAQRTDAVLTQLWGDVLEGKSFSQIAATPAAVENPKVLLQVRDYLENQAARDENRAYTREQRAYTATLRRERELEVNGWGEYWALSDPNTLRGMSRGQILQKFPTLGREHVNRLLTDQESLLRNDAAVKAATIDDDLFKEVAFNAGLDYVYNTPANLSPEQRANLGKLRATVEAEIGRSQQGGGRVLALEEKRELMTKLVDGKVLFDRAFWYDDAGVGASVANADDQAKAYVPLGEIPPANIREAVNYLRSTNPAFARLTDEQIRGRAQRAIERAYAAKVMRLGPEEELGRLTGTR